MRILFSLLFVFAFSQANAQFETKSVDTTKSSSSGRVRFGIDKNGRSGYKGNSGSFVPTPKLSDVLSLGDTTLLPGVTGGVGIRAINNNLFLTPQTGNVIQVPVNLRSIKEFLTYTNGSAVYDGSIWVRKISSPTVTTATVGYGSMKSATVGGFHYERQYVPGTIESTWFGVTPSGFLDNYQAIQNAIDFATAQQAANSLPIRQTVVLPAGDVLVMSNNKSINVTSREGIWIKGAGTGSYLNTTLTGVTGNDKPVIDFTGCSACGASDFMIRTENGFANKSGIGIMAALGQNNLGQQTGGLNTHFKNIHMDMAIDTTLNGGHGSIGFFVCRAEEGSATDLLLRVETPFILTGTNALVTKNRSVTFASGVASTTMMQGSGSMGVYTITGSLQAKTKRNHALLLYGTNSIKVNGGYLTQYQTAVGGGNETAAIGIYQSSFNIDVSGTTIEGFGTIAYLGKSARLINPVMNITTANHTVPTAPLFYQDGDNAQGASIEGGGIRVSFGNPSTELNNGRVFLYSVPNGSDSPSLSVIRSCRFDVPQWIDGTKFISPDLLRKCVGRNEFNMAFPLVKDEGWIKNPEPITVNMGTIGSSPVSATLAQFTSATTASGNGGFYGIKISGFVSVGGSGSGGGVTVPIEVTGVMQQNNNGAKLAFSYTSLVLGKSYTNPTYANITDSGIIPNLTFSSNGYGNIILTVSASGSGTGESVFFTGTVAINANFRVKSSILTF